MAELQLMSQACERCWRRKQKCSREIPICSQCRTSSASCSRRRFGSTVDSSIPGNETYIESLKTRIRNLQLRVQYESQRDIHTNHADSYPQVISERQSEIAEASDTLSVDPALGNPLRNDLQDTMQEASYLSLSAMAERTDRQSFQSNGLSFLTLLYAATGISGSNPTLPLGSNLCLSGPLADFRKSVLPNIEHLDGPEMRAAFHCYTDMIRQSFPFMTTTELLGQYEDIIHDHGDGRIQRMMPEKMVLTYIGIATGILLSPNYTYKEVLATELAVRAAQLMPDVFDHAGILCIVRCLTALTIFSLFTTFGGSTWHLLGLTMTRSISSGMHTVRVSDPHSNNEEKRHSNRTFWTLFILDTYVSTTLGRPFCLNDHDIMISAPSSPPSKIPDVDNEDVLYQHLMQHAQILRSICQRQNSGADILCHFINLRHWKETFPLQGSTPAYNYTYLCTQGYVQLLIHPAFIHEPDRASVFRQAEEEFSDYLKLVEDRLNSQSGSVAGIDALHIFTLGTLFATYSQFSNSNGLAVGNVDGVNSAEVSARSRRTSQALNVLTLLSTRYAAVRSIRDVLSELQWAITQDTSRVRLRMLVECSEIAIPSQIQALIFGDSLSSGEI